jgi:TolA-binding protein
MATESAQWAETDSSASIQRGSPRSLWQAPVFLIGLLALGAALALHFILQAEIDALPRSEVACAALRNLLRQPAPPRERLAALVDEVAAFADARGDQAGDAHFLAGSGYLRLAEQTPENHLASALEELQRAEALGVADADSASLRYRLGIALGRTHADPKKILEYLSGWADQTEDNPAEGYALRMDACLSLQPPDVEGALAANASLLQLPTNDDKLMAPIRLLRGQLLLQQQRASEAREVLKRIGPPAAPEIQAKALDLLAHSYEEDGLWAEAAKVWEEWLLRSDVPRNAARISYFLGRCYARLDQPVDAEQTWLKALPTAAGDERVALGFALAELRLQETQGADALETFEQALRDVKNSGEFPGALVDVRRARDQIERALSAYLEGGKYEGAAQLAHVYERIAVSGRAQALQGQAEEKAAHALQAAVQGSTDDVPNKEKEEAVRAHFRHAGAAYAAAADLTTDLVEKATRLWCSGDRYFKGQDFERAATALDRFTQLGQLPETLGEAWYFLGKARLALKQPDAAAQAFAEALNHRGPFEYKARLELALCKMARGERDAAKDFLDRNITLLRQGLPDPEAYAGSLAALGHLLYDRKVYGEAAACLQEAADKGGLTLDLDGRVALIECYRQLAILQIQVIKSQERNDPEFFKHAVELKDKWLRLAVAEAKGLAKELIARREKAVLREDEENCYFYVTMTEAQAYSDLGEYTNARHLFEALAARYHHKPESLTVLAHIRECYWRENRPEEARHVLERMHQELPDVVFTNAKPDDDDWGREQWQRWIDKQRAN